MADQTTEQPNSADHSAAASTHSTPRSRPNSVGSGSVDTGMSLTSRPRSESPSGIRRTTKVVIRETSTRTSYKPPTVELPNASRVITTTTEVTSPKGHHHDSEEQVVQRSFKEIGDIAQDLQEYSNWCSTLLANNPGIASTAPAPSLGYAPNSQSSALHQQIQEVTSANLQSQQREQHLEPQREPSPPPPPAPILPPPEPVVYQEPIQQPPPAAVVLQQEVILQRQNPYQYSQPPPKTTVAQPVVIKTSTTNNIAHIPNTQQHPQQQVNTSRSTQQHKQTKMPMARLAEEEFATDGGQDYNDSGPSVVVARGGGGGQMGESRNIFCAPECPIAWVTVYLDKAEVCRCVRPKVNAGEFSEIVFTRLSPSIDKDSIRVEVKGPATIQDVNFHARRLQEDEANLSKVQHELKEKIKQQKSHIDMLVAKQHRLEKQRIVLDTFADTLIEHKDQKEVKENGPVDAFDPKHMDTLNSFFGLYENQAERLDEGMMNVKDDMEKTHSNIKDLEKMLKDVELRHDEQMARELSVLIESRDTTQIELYFSYIVNNTKWTPTYDIRIFNSDGNMKIVYYGMVQQATGEDWETGQLVLSTSQPGVGGTVPDLGIQRIHFKSSKTPIPRLDSPKEALPFNLPLSPTPTSPNKQKNVSRHSSTLRKSKRLSTIESNEMMMGPASMNSTLERQPEDSEMVYMQKSPGFDKMSSDTNLSMFGSRQMLMESQSPKPLPLTPHGTLKRGSDPPTQSTQFEVARPPAIIPCDNEGHRVTVAIIDLSPTFEYISAPKRSPFAYLKASVVNASKFALLAGQTNVYVDNNFVGKSSIGAVAPNEDFTCYLGADHGIKVAYNPMFKYKEVSGTGGKNASVTFKQIIEVKNTHERVIKILIMDQLPISAEDKIKVSLLEPVIKHPEKYDKSKPVRINRANNVEWDLEIQPGEVKELVLKYVVEHPVSEEVDVSFSEV